MTTQQDPQKDPQQHPTTDAPTDARREERGGRQVVVLERTYRAGITDVWAACTDPERMQRWIGTWSGDPAAGEVEFRMTAEGEDVAAEVWDVDACEPPHRFAVRSRVAQPFSEDGSGDPVPWVMTLALDEVADGTRLLLTQEIAHADVAASVGPGWEYYLARLAAAVEGGEVSAVAWDAFEGRSADFRALFS